MPTTRTRLRAAARGTIAPASASRCCRCSTRRAASAACRPAKASAASSARPIRCCACSERLRPLCEAQGARLGLAPHSLRAVPPEALRDALAGLDAHRCDGADPHPHRRADRRGRRLPRLERPAAGRMAARPRARSMRAGAWCMPRTWTRTSTGARPRAARSRACVRRPRPTSATASSISAPGARPAARWGVGSDSHACVNAAEELLMLEYSQRLATRQRNVGADAAQPQVASAMTLARRAGRRAGRGPRDRRSRGRPAGRLRRARRRAYVALQGLCRARHAFVPCVREPSHHRHRRRVGRGPAARRGGPPSSSRRGRGCLRRRAHQLLQGLSPMTFHDHRTPFPFPPGTRPLLISMPHVGTHVPPQLAARLTRRGTPRARHRLASGAALRLRRRTRRLGAGRDALALRGRPQPSAETTRTSTRARTPPACARSTPSTRRRSMPAGDVPDDAEIAGARRGDLAALPPAACRRARAHQGAARHRRAVGRAFDPLGAAALLRGQADRSQPRHRARRELRSGARADAARHRHSEATGFTGVLNGRFTGGYITRQSRAARAAACMRCSSK